MLLDFNNAMTTDFKETGFINLVVMAQSGDPESLETLAGRVQGRLEVYIYRLTLNHDVTQELCQQMQLKLVESLPSLRRPETFWPWLYRHALGQVQHYFRDRQRRCEIELKAINNEALALYAAGDHQDGLKRLTRLEMVDVVIDAMAQLKLRYRNILILRCLEGLSYAEIGKQLGCRELHARVLFHRAKTTLRDHLQGRGYTRETLITALVLFGLATSQAKSVSTSAVLASMNVGPVALALASFWGKWFWVGVTTLILTASSFSLEQKAIGCLILLTCVVSFIIGLCMDL